MKKVAKDRASEIRALKRLKDKQIDLSDIPELTTRVQISGLTDLPTLKTFGAEQF